MRRAGLSIDVLKKYFELFKRGKRTLKARRDLLANERKILQERLVELQSTLQRLDYKITVYDQAIASKDKELKF
jgi:DNA-binding transcriptional MerR regulator